MSLTFSAWMGLVTLNLSIVDRMMEGVVRKKSTTKRVKLMLNHRNHQWGPWMERFCLQRGNGAQASVPGTGHQHQLYWS